MNISDYIGIPTAYAAATTPIAKFVGKVNRIILNPLIILMFAAALVYFLYGVLQFILNQDQADEREIGKSHMVWGIVGMFIMFAVFTILNIIQRTLGVSGLNANIPTQ